MTEITPQFWRDPQLPFVEARAIGDGRRVCYALHSHEFFSIGAITGGTSTYLNGERRLQVSSGDVVIINPQQAHACNPIADQRWSYIMFYIDLAWLGALQQELAGGGGDRFIPFTQALSRDAALFVGLNQLYALLIDPQLARLEKHIALVEYFSTLQRKLGGAGPGDTRDHPRLEAAAAYISAHCTQPLMLEDICRAAALSPSYLIRAFRQRYGMTPHAYLVNRRIQYGHRLLRCGYPIAVAASESGFADQAHFQRTFKLLLAATPGQYQKPSASR
ncbi:helix-turn-helix transcriptional regulator [Serratia entomophila]|uniref:helix-turn-helix transcriptional regulator n=1 Tax=Serratia entomophila TaxID=42906 RepID=UPI0021785937|nr:AraC family transcriptional regulator [Serratia entomophila]CAI0797280.1 L-rhamnose operon transcriptional activator rhaR [Serratia entomophila]CAI1563769.1 L-rhamnose operon transcriptional activator rhaR [Serratia entomophila]CAI1573218.1 L-rhamnose operon transcriptional activator rhaR [Serratia entomophila]CAI1611841.1 L-rhamnose operon transcriptional activator rhaR [Serratia entomophila]CAI1687044.1 L-rhamnose operon transcriptional activator rhaR [Serratia entomophila]